MWFHLFCMLITHHGSYTRQFVSFRVHVCLVWSSSTLPRSSGGHFGDWVLLVQGDHKIYPQVKPVFYFLHANGKERFITVQLIYLEYLIWTRQPSRYWVGEGRKIQKEDHIFAIFTVFPTCSSRFLGEGLMFIMLSGCQSMF